MAPEIEGLGMNVDKFMNETPHPLVEDHYYIRDLIAKQEIRSKDKQRWKNIKAEEDSFFKWCDGFKDIETFAFWCSHCDLDFTARAKKQIDGWENIAYYKTKHRCGTWSIRLITDRELDPYFYRSRRVALDRGIGSNDMLQPFETGFNMVYGKK